MPVRVLPASDNVAIFADIATPLLAPDVNPYEVKSVNPEGKTTVGLAYVKFAASARIKRSPGRVFEGTTIVVLAVFST
jgi:hypothetical protein